MAINHKGFANPQKTHALFAYRDDLCQDKFRWRIRLVLSRSISPDIPVGKYLSAIVVFVSVTALTLFSFFIAYFNTNPAQSETGTAAWLILFVGMGLACGLAAYLVLSTRQTRIQEQLRRDRDKLENLLVSARKLETMAQLVGTIGHDFNNVLMTVSGYANLALAKNEGTNDTEMQEYLDLVNLSADKGARLIKKLLSFSRSKSHRHGNSMDLVPAVENTVNLLGQVLPEDISIQVAIADSLPALKADSLAIEQIVTNLVINARDAIEHAGIIDISLAPATVTEQRCNSCQQNFSGEFVCLAVTDTGKGLTLENVDDIFQPFYTTKNDGKGAGLGMALLQNLVHGCGGHIQLTSEPGKGTVVAIFLPVPAAAVNKTQRSQ
jgi:signal transduction histidine kinase